MRKSQIIAAPLLAAPFIGHLAAYGNANTLTNLIPDLFVGMDIVSRELVGFIPSVSRNGGVERAAVGETVRWHIAPAVVGVDITPAMVIPEPADLTIGNGVITITKARAFPFGFVGEEQRGLNNGPGYTNVQADLFAQALRGLTNEVEVDLAAVSIANASRVFGTAATIPFTTDLEESAQLRKILDDNGAPGSGRSVIIDTTVGVKLRKLQQLTKANEAGTTMTLRDGQLLDIHGMSFKESAQIKPFTKGTNAGSTTNAAGYAIGATVITLAVAGTGTLKAGDIITFAGDTNKYVIASGDADVSNGGTITLNNPGLRVAIPTAATAITTFGGATWSAAVGFSQDAVRLAFRPPALPQEGDAAIDSMMLTDPRSGLSFEVRLYAGYRKIRAEVGGAWGVAAVKPAHIAMLAY